MPTMCRKNAKKMLQEYYKNTANNTTKNTTKIPKIPRNTTRNTEKMQQSTARIIQEILQ